MPHTRGDGRLHFRRPRYASVDHMPQMTVDDYREGFRNHTLAFCMPAAHAEFSNDFLDEFSERILKKDWRDISIANCSSIASLLTGNVSEEEIVAEIHEFYGVDVSDLPGLNFWDVARRCAGSAA
jgi:hypothetical protein